MSPVASFTKEVNPRLAKRPLFLVKKDTGLQNYYLPGQTVHRLKSVWCGSYNSLTYHRYISCVKSSHNFQSIILLIPGTQRTMHNLYSADHWVVSHYDIPNTDCRICLVSFTSMFPLLTMTSNFMFDTSINNIAVISINLINLYIYIYIYIYVCVYIDCTEI